MLVWLWIFIFFFGTVALTIARQRTKATIAMQNWVVQAAASLYSEAEEVGIHDQQILVKLHNQLIYIAALAPSLAAGQVKIGIGSEDGMNKEDRRDLDRFITQNYWVAGYAIVGFVAAEVLQFHANPYNWNTWKGAFMASFAYRCRRKDGGLNITISREDVLEKLEDTVRMQSPEYGNAVTA